MTWHFTCFMTVDLSLVLSSCHSHEDETAISLTARGWERCLVRPVSLHILFFPKVCGASPAKDRTGRRIGWSSRGPEGTKSSGILGRGSTQVPHTWYAPKGISSGSVRGRGDSESGQRSDNMGGEVTETSPRLLFSQPPQDISCSKGIGGWTRYRCAFRVTPRVAGEAGPVCSLQGSRLPREQG